MPRPFTLPAAAALLSLQAAPALAQTPRAETQVQAVVVVTDGCLLAGSTATAGDLKSVGGHGPIGAAVATFGAQVLGDLVSAGAGILAGALEEASRERAIVYSGRSSFEFYQFAREVAPASAAGPSPSDSASESQAAAGTPEPQQQTETARLAEPRSLVAVSPSTGGQCLIISVPDRVVMASAARERATLLPLTEAQKTDLIAGQLNDGGSSEWAALGLPPQPALYMEAELQARPDGFRIRPVLLWRQASLPGTRRQALPMELHVTFAVPALATDQAPIGTPFAVARMPLPALTPGENPIMGAATLRPYASEVMPMRPFIGSPATALAALTAAEKAVIDNQEAIDLARRTEQRARPLAAAAGSTPAAVAALHLAEDQLADAQAARAGLVARATALAGEAVDARTGSTNVQARIVLIQDQNRFGMALAKAIRDRGPAVGAAITADLAPQTRAQAWTAADTNYVTSISTVQSKADALARAVAAGDANLVLAARLELQNAQAAANAAAAASDRPLPFPNVI